MQTVRTSDVDSQEDVAVLAEQPTLLDQVCALKGDIELTNEQVEQIVALGHLCTSLTNGAFDDPDDVTEHGHHYVAEVERVKQGGLYVVLGHDVYVQLFGETPFATDGSHDHVGAVVDVGEETLSHTAGLRSILHQFHQEVVPRLSPDDTVDDDASEDTN